MSADGTPAELDVAPDRLTDRSSGVDLARAEKAVRELLIAVGEDPDREGLLETPARVARAYAEIFAGLFVDPDDVLQTTFDEHHDELVLVKDIPLYSTCEHHLVPWHGTAAVGYIPGADGRITGLSKLARVVDLYARRPQVQERLTSQVADAVMRRLAPRGVIVVVHAEHLCMSMRGIRKPGATTMTSAVRGIFKSDPRSRAEALNLILGRTDTPAHRRLLERNGQPIPAGMATPEEVAEIGLERLPHGPDYNWGQADDVAGYAPNSPAERRARILKIEEMSRAYTGKR